MTASKTASGAARLHFPMPAAGLVSTIDDYLAFGQMMLNQGKHGERAHPVAAFGRDDDDRPADARAESGCPASSPASGTAAAGGSACPWSPGATTWRRFPDGSAGTAASARPGASDPAEEMVGDPDDPAGLDFPPGLGCLSRFLDLGLPGDRRLSAREVRFARRKPPAFLRTTSTEDHEDSCSAWDPEKKDLVRMSIPRCFVRRTG